MNVRELKAQMVRKGLTAEQLCELICISQTSWYRKIKGANQFTQGEIMAIRRELELDDHQTAQIFFDDQVS